MRPIAERTCTGDLETVYESEKAYVKLLQQIGEITDIVFHDCSETWDKAADIIEIAIRFSAEGRPYKVWMQRHSDFIDSNVLLLLNALLGLKRCRLEISYNTESVYFITAAEKRQLEAEGIAFAERPDFHFLLFNALKFEETTFYTIIEEINTGAAHYAETHKGTEHFRQMQETIREELLPKIPWEMIQEKGIDMSGIIELVS